MSLFLDECQWEDVCSETSKCKNTLGSFVCNCHQVRDTISRLPDDLKSCSRTRSLQDVPTRSKLYNIPDEGYISNGLSCVDIDECVDQNPPVCDDIADSTCVNSIGSYSCNCDSGMAFSQ